MFGTRKLGRTTAQRKAMLRQLTTDLLEKGRIETTVTRAKEVQPIAVDPLRQCLTEYVRISEHIRDQPIFHRFKKRGSVRERKMLLFPIYICLENNSFFHISPFFSCILRIFNCYNGNMENTGACKT